MFFIPFGTREHSRKQKFAYVTMLLILINILIFAYQIYLGTTFGGEALNSFLNTYAATPSKITDSTPLEYGLFTSMFLHAGFLHIASNMIYLFPFGDNVEDRLGHLRYIIFYLACGLIATFTHIAFSPNSDVPSLGASGAIAGILAGYLVLFPKGIVKGILFILIFFTKIEFPAIIFIGFWFITQLFNSYISLGAQSDDSGGVAFLAHVGGFIAGLVLAPLLAASNPVRNSADQP